MTKSFSTVLAFAATLGALSVGSASAQNAILAEMYGRGVHAYYAGQQNDALEYLSMAIDNGIQDPRAYYFRGMVAHCSGRPYEAESDWQLGAEMEANGRANPSIGRSLARFQGAGRIQLEEIRQKARLSALSTAMSRSQQRYGELGANPGAPAAPPAPGIAPPAPGVPPAAVPPTPAVPPAADDPFADDMAQGQPNVVADDALEGAMDDPFAGEPGGGGAAPAADANPFGADAGAANDPFGGGGDAGADPFGGDGGGAMDDPFGGGGDSGGGDDPFGGNPFGS